MSYETVEEQLLDAIEPREFIEFMGWEMKKQGSTYRGCCPIHGGNNDSSFAYNPRVRNFYCATGCGRVGNFIRAYAKFHHVSFEKAIVELAKWKGIQVSGRKMRSPKPVMVEKKLKVETPAAIETLPLVKPYEKKGLFTLTEHPRFSMEAIQRFDIKEGRSGRYKNRTVFPIYDFNGRYVGNNGRWNGEDYQENSTSKYLYSAVPFQTRFVLYGAHLAKESPYWIIHEGVTDVIKAFEHGYEAVAQLGSFLSPEQIELIRQHPKPIVLGHDGDSAGRKASKQAIEWLFARHMTDVTVMIFPEGKDPGNLTKPEYDQVFASRVSAIAFLSQCS